MAIIALPMTPERRKNLLRVMDGYTDLIGLMKLLHREERCDDICHWLIAHHYTGHTLAQWYKSEFAPNPRFFLAHVITLFKNSNVLAMHRKA